jgi:hypothetical protein
VHSEIGLAVAVQVKFAQGKSAFDWRLENSGSHVDSVPNDFARKSDIERDDLH